MKGVDARDLVFIDESAAHTAMTRSHAWVKKGTEPVELRPFVHWHQLTMCGAITVDGWLAFSTSWQTMNKERFTIWVRDVLAPRLRLGNIVIMDNLRAHHAPRVRELIEARGATIRFLPPYSPDLNPIEPCWAIVKKELRRCAIRNKEALRRGARRARERVRAAHTKAFSHHAGYRYRLN
jgi:transposase